MYALHCWLTSFLVHLGHRSPRGCVLYYRLIATSSRVQIGCFVARIAFGQRKNCSQLVERNDTLGQRIGSPIGESEDSFVEPSKEESKVPCTLLDIQSPTLKVAMVMHRTK